MNFGTELQNTMLYVDRIKSVLKSQHKLQFILIYTDQISNYFAKSAKSRHLVKITANSENHGFGDFLLSMISINVKNFHGSLTTVVRAQNDTTKTANITDTIFDRTLV